MATASIATQTVSLNLSLARFSRAAAPDTGSEQPKPESDRVYSVADDTAALIDKLDTALDVIRGDRTGRRGGEGRRVGYDDRGRFPLEGRSGQTPTGATLAASVEKTEISLSPDGISYRKASLGLAAVDAAGARAAVLSYKVTEAYVGFAKAGAPTALVA